VVLPLENSAAGEVGTVMDLIFSGDLFVNQVVDLPIEHNLLGVEGASLGRDKDRHQPSAGA
jgi:Prephenate dehydratase